MEMWRRRYGDVLMKSMMIRSDTGLPVEPAVRRGVQANFCGGVLDQEGDSVSDLKCFKPPLDIVPKGLLEINTLSEFSRPPFRRQNSVDE